MRRALLFMPFAALLLSGCEIRIGNDAPPVADNATAAGRAQDGQFTIEAPGFNLSVTVPEGFDGRSETGGDSGLVYPGARVAGIHVQGGRDRDEHGRDEVELRLTAADAPARVVAWYRDPGRADRFTIASATREGDVTVLTGTGRRDSERFTLRIGPRAGGGGSDMRLLIADGG
ncbi:MAG: hypothetical protein AB7O91_11115 [Sphingomonas sp.]